MPAPGLGFERGSSFWREGGCPSGAAKGPLSAWTLFASPPRKENCYCATGVCSPPHRPSGCLEHCVTLLLGNDMFIGNSRAKTCSLHWPAGPDLNARNPYAE